MRVIDERIIIEYLNLMYDNQNDIDEPFNCAVLAVKNFIIHRAPTIELVRCKECKYSKPSDIWAEVSTCVYKPLPSLRCEEFQLERDADDFCSYGVKQTERNEQHTCNNCKFETNEWFEEKCDSCCGAHSNWQPQTAKG